MSTRDTESEPTIVVHDSHADGLRVVTGGPVPAIRVDWMLASEDLTLIICKNGESEGENTQ